MASRRTPRSARVSGSALAAIAAVLAIPVAVWWLAPAPREPERVAPQEARVANRAVESRAVEAQRGPAPVAPAPAVVDPPVPAAIAEIDPLPERPRPDARVTALEEEARDEA